MSKNKKDYTRNFYAAKDLADCIMDWYHKRGYIGVKTWVEEDRRVSPLGTRLPSNYSVQSNISFSVDRLEDPMIE